MADLTGERKREILKVSVDRSLALRFLGYRGQSVEGELLERFEELACRCESINQARFCWFIDRLDNARSLSARAVPSESASEGASSLRLFLSGLELEGHAIARHLAGARYVALLACTLGSVCERDLAQMRALSSVDHLLYDACASSLAEEAMEEAHRRLGVWAQDNGLVVRARFSPGYGDLPLSVQGPFLRAVDAARQIGLTVNEDDLLVPTKSVTALVGLFEEYAEDAPVERCAQCVAMSYCSFRERGACCYG